MIGSPLADLLEVAGFVHELDRAIKQASAHAYTLATSST